MASPHISKERLQALMFAIVHLTEEERRDGIYQARSGARQT